MSQLDDVLREFESDVSNFIATDVVDIESGMSMGGHSVDPDFDGSVASAAFSDVVKAYKRAFDLLDMDPESLQDILGTADDVLVLTRIIGDRTFYHGLTISKEGNLALARKTMEAYEDRIIDAVGIGS
jgi:predicted regulator of Ras-like GTPase activity (Roadblock/LC7/MglB family)